jgi:hypothetical protein
MTPEEPPTQPATYSFRTRFATITRAPKRVYWCCETENGRHQRAPDEPLPQPGPGRDTEPVGDGWHPISWPVWALIVAAALTVAATVVAR